MRACLALREGCAPAAMPSPALSPEHTHLGHRPPLPWPLLALPVCFATPLLHTAASWNASEPAQPLPRSPSACSNTLLSKCAPAQGGGPPAVGASPPSPVAPPAGASCQGDPLSQFIAALAKCNATSLAPGTPCCNGIQALGGTCLGEVLAAVASNATKAYLT